MIERPAIGRAWSRWRHFSRRERLFACWLKLESGWPGVDLVTGSAFNTDDNRVAIEHDGHVIVAICRWDEAETLARIEAKHGAEARRKAEEACAS